MSVSFSLGSGWALYSAGKPGVLHRDNDNGMAIGRKEQT